MPYKYCIQFPDDEYYRSNHDEVSLDYRSEPHEADATFMNEADLRYLLENAELPSYSRIGIVLAGTYIGEIYLYDLRASWLNLKSEGVDW